MEEHNDVDVENVESERITTSENTEAPEVTPVDKPKFLKLPLTRIRHIMKMDPDCGLINADAAFLVTKSTELFLEQLAKESAKFMLASKRKTLQKKDVDAAVDNIPNLCFLDGALE